MLPEISFDTDTFQGLIEEARTMLSGVYPEWTNYNYSDPGITFLELFAWLKEGQQFYMEQLGDSHYEQFFKLLGFKRRGRRPGRVLARPRVPVSVHIPADTRFYAGDIPFETVVEETLIKDGLCGISHGGQELSLPSPAGSMDLYPFGTAPCQGDRCTLAFSSPLEPGFLYHIDIRLTKERSEARNPLEGNGMTPLVRLSWSVYTGSGWQELTDVEDETHAFLFSGRVGIRIPKAMAPVGEKGRYVLRVSLKEGQYDLPPVFSEVSMDGLVLEQKRSWKGEPFLLAEGNGFPFQAYRLPWERPIADTVKLLVQDILDPESFTFWERVEDLSGCGPDAPVYMIDEETGTLHFGDGHRGLPPEGKIYLVSMEETMGAAGNVKTGTFLKAESGPGLGVEVSGELVRGADGEQLQEAILRAGTERPERLRAVTPKDYEELVLHTPGLAIYSCKVLQELSTGNEIAIVVRPGDGKEDLPLSPGYKKNILDHLEPKRLIGTRIRLLAPEYIQVRIYLEVTVMPQFRQAEQMIRDAVQEWFSRLGDSFGAPVSYGNLYGMLDSMACVRRLKLLNLEAGSASVRRSPGGDLLPPPNGVFLLKQVGYTARNDRGIDVDELFCDQ